MNWKIKIRIAKSKDKRKIKSLAVKYSNLLEWESKRFELLISLGLNAGFLIIENSRKEILGFADYGTYKNYSILDNIVIDPKHQGKNFGTILIYDVLKRILLNKELSNNLITKTKKDNLRMHNLLKKLSFISNKNNTIWKLTLSEDVLLGIKSSIKL
jgi:ribosomal protein S18 acetylase RimI-like enzyme